MSFNPNKHFFLLQEVWACWHELLSYLDAENKWLNEVELKLKATENIQGGAEEISESLDVSADVNNTSLNLDPPKGNRLIYRIVPYLVIIKHML